MILQMANIESRTTHDLKSRPKSKFPLHPKRPERICWGCDKLCPADDMRCGNGTIRAPHPAELFGDDWDG
jgi:hypothetical protein